MLNKLSFNIMNELNESDTNTYQIKKKVLMEGNKVEIQELQEAEENQDMNPEKKETLNEKPNDISKEDRLASLKVQLAQDGDQLAPDEREAIEKEVADLEAELFPIDETEESRYKIEESIKEKVESKIYEATVSNLKVSRHEGNIFMLESANKYIVGENYNESEHLIENAEMYDLEEDANKDYNNRIGLNEGFFSSEIYMITLDDGTEVLYQPKQDYRNQDWFADFKEQHPELNINSLDQIKDTREATIEEVGAHNKEVK